MSQYINMMSYLLDDVLHNTERYFTYTPVAIMVV